MPSWTWRSRFPLVAALHDLTRAGAPDVPDRAPAPAKRYPRMPRIALGTASSLAHADASDGLSAASLGCLLAAASGIDGIPAASTPPAAELIEVYVAVRAIIGVTPGLYHWDAGTAALEMVPIPEGREPALWSALEPGPVYSAAAVVLAGRAGLATSVAGPRGYRRMLLAVGAIIAAFTRAADASRIPARTLDPLDEGQVEEVLGLGADDELALAVVALGAPTIAHEPTAEPQKTPAGVGGEGDDLTDLVTLALPVSAITELPRSGRARQAPGLATLLAAEKLLDVTLGVRVPPDLAALPRDLWPAYGRLLHLVRAGLDVTWGALTFAPDEPRLPGYWVRVDGIRGSAVDVASRARALHRALGEAVERFVWHRPPGHREIRRSAPAGLSDAVLDLDTLAGYSDDLRSSTPRLQWDANTSFHWVRGVSLTARTPVWVPLQLVSADERCGDEPELRPRVTTGVAAHPDRDAAILNGLLEVIERDAFMLTWLARRPAVRLDIQRTEDCHLRTFVERLVAARFTPRAVRLDTNTGVPVVLGVVLDESGTGPRMSVGAAAHPSVAGATLAALGEAFASWKWTQRLARSNRAVPEDAVDLDLETRLLWWSQGDRWRDLEWLWRGPAEAIGNHHEPALALHDLVGRLRDLGEDVIVVDLTTEPLAVRFGHHVVAVVVPGFHPMHLRERRPALSSRRLAALLRTARDPAMNALPHPFP